jgi:hypothetical protein
MSTLVRHAEHRLASWPARAGAVVGADCGARESASSGRRLAVGRSFAALWCASSAGESRTRRSRRQLVCRVQAALLASVVFTVPGCIESAQSAAECEPADAAVDATRDAGRADGGYDADVLEVLPVWVYLHGLPPVATLASDSYPGQDVCSLTFACANRVSGFAVEAVEEPGGGLFPELSRPGFPLPRDPSRALGPEDADCKHPQHANEVSNFVTLGHQGSIYLRVAPEDQRGPEVHSFDLSGCILHIQFAEGSVEPMLVELCLEAHPDTCQALAEIPMAFAPDGVNVFVPAL